MNLLYILDLLGVVVFATSGAIVARDKQFDLFGGIVLAIATAIGGGTFRDIVLGYTPIFWLKDLSYFALAGSTAVISLWVFRAHRFNASWRNMLLIADAAGLAVFTVIGVEVALNANVHPAMAVAMGTITGCFGGVIRDVLANREPLIFQKEIYATASLVGGTCYLALHQFTEHSALHAGACMLATFLLRMVALHRGWQLPTYQEKN